NGSSEDDGGHPARLQYDADRARVEWGPDRLSKRGDAARNVDEPVAVGAENRELFLSGQRDELPLALDPLISGLREPRGENDEVSDSDFGHFADDLEYNPSRHHQICQVDRAREVSR